MLIINIYGLQNVGDESEGLRDNTYKIFRERLEAQLEKSRFFDGPIILKLNPDGYCLLQPNPPIVEVVVEAYQPISKGKISHLTITLKSLLIAIIGWVTIEVRVVEHKWEG